MLQYDNFKTQWTFLYKLEIQVEKIKFFSCTAWNVSESMLNTVSNNFNQTLGSSNAVGRYCITPHSRAASVPSMVSRAITVEALSTPFLSSGILKVFRIVKNIAWVLNHGTGNWRKVFKVCGLFGTNSCKIMGGFKAKTEHCGYSSESFQRFEKCFKLHCKQINQVSVLFDRITQKRSGRSNVATCQSFSNRCILKGSRASLDRSDKNIIPL